MILATVAHNLSHRITLTGIGHDFVMNHTTAKYLHPVAIEEDVELKRRFCEGKVVLPPSHLNIAE